MGRLALYWQFVVVSLTSQMQYRASFMFSAFGQFLATGIEIIGIWALFERFGQPHTVDAAAGGHVLRCSALRLCHCRCFIQWL